MTKTFEELSAPPEHANIPQLCPLPVGGHPLCTNQHYGAGIPVAHPLTPTSPVPEPSTVITMVAGLALIALMRWRRKWTS